MTKDKIAIELENIAEMAGFSRFLLGAMATWRITELLFDEAAPFELAEKMRTAIYRRIKVHIIFKEMHKALQCPWCLSIWVGWLVAILQGDKRWWLTGFGYSAAALLIRTWRMNHGTSNNHNTPQP